MSICLAMCCHHLCVWEDYVNPKLLVAHGIGPGDFQLMKRLCTKSRTHPAQKVLDGLDEAKARQLGTARAWEAALRAEVGILSKRLLNEGRAAWLAQQGWSRVELCRYVTPDVTPENQVLLGAPQ